MSESPENRCQSRRTGPAVVAALAILSGACQRHEVGTPKDPNPEPVAGANWEAYLGDLGSHQASTLDQINRSNVADLEVAWTWDSGESDPDSRSQIQCNPLIVDGILYATTARLRVVALDAATGRTLWSFDPEGRGTETTASVNRGLVLWRHEDEVRLFAGLGSYLWALDVADGEPIGDFGEDGRIDLRTGLGTNDTLHVTSTTPGVAFEDLLIWGSRVSEGLPAAPGHIRAFDARTGEQRWIFHTIPLPGEPGHETWPDDAWQRIGGANAWAGLSLDRERGIVYIPTGSAAFDFWGGNRIGANLYANTLLALDARTGRRVWHFQTVRHDLWDRDLPAPPNLVRVHHDGRWRDAVAQITKSAHVFLFDRDTGEPLFPIEEVEAPASDLVGEESWPTQPLPSRPPPFARQRFTPEEATTRTPEGRAAVLDRLQRSRSGHPFTPPSREGTVILPGYDGGGEWGGAAADPDTGILYVNASEMAWILTMVDTEDLSASGPNPVGQSLYATQCLWCHGVDRQGDTLQTYPSLSALASRISEEEARTIILSGRDRMPGFGHLDENELEYLLALLFERPPAPDRPRSPARAATRYLHTGWNRFLDPDGLPALAPPWGTLTALDLNEGSIRWQVPLGDFPEWRAEDEPDTGAENYGGPIVTAGGLVFIAATADERIRAFDKDTGEELWQAPLPAAGFATPATYSVEGRQFLVIATGGGKIGRPSADKWVAFSLP